MLCETHPIPRILGRSPQDWTLRGPRRLVWNTSKQHRRCETPAFCLAGRVENCRQLVWHQFSRRLCSIQKNTSLLGGWCFSSEKHRVASEGGVISSVCEAKRLGFWVLNSFNTRFLGEWCGTPVHSTKGAKHPCSAKQGTLKTDANSFGTSVLKE